MKFFIYLSLLILILTPFSSVACRKSSNKSKKRRNPPVQIANPPAQTASPPAVGAGAPSVTSVSSSNAASTSQATPNIEIQRPYVNSAPASIARPVQTVVTRPPFLSGPPQGPRIVRSGFVSSPMMAVRRYAVVRRTLNECPLDFHDNSLVKEVAEFCPRVCSKRYCIQLSEICCIYRDYRDLRSRVIATRILRKK